MAKSRESEFTDIKADKLSKSAAWLAHMECFFLFKFKIAESASWEIGALWESRSAMSSALSQRHFLLSHRISVHCAAAHLFTRPRTENRTYGHRPNWLSQLEGQRRIVGSLRIFQGFDPRSFASARRGDSAMSCQKLPTLEMVRFCSLLLSYSRSELSLGRVIEMEQPQGISLTEKARQKCQPCHMMFHPRFRALLAERI